MSARGRKVEHRLRLVPGTLERCAALVPHVRAAPELAMTARVTRADVERLALLRGLAALEGEFMPAPARLPGSGDG